MKRFIAILCPITIALSVLCANIRTASASEHVLVILDTTGSMGTILTGTTRRLDAAEMLLTSQLLGFTDPANEYSLWFFDSSIGAHEVVPFTIGNTGRTQVISQLATAAPGAATPLAQTICAGVDALASRGAPADTRRIILASDGEENATPTLDQCFGPPTTTLTSFPFDDDSWQNRVLKKLCTGDANSPSITPCDFLTDLAFVVDVNQIFDFSAVTLATRRVVAEPGSRLAKTAAVAPPPDIDQVFFSTLADITNGTYVGVTSTTPLNDVIPAPGDANHDHCVTLLDRTQVLNDSGGAGNGFDDFNRNGVVDNSDLQVVLQHLGECTPFISVDAPKAIPDNNATGVTSSVSVNSPSLHMRAIKVDVDITHTFRGDLVIQVVAPNGAVATLSNRAGGSDDNYVVTGLDITKMFPVAALTAGTWSLFVRDLAAADVGTINKFKVTVTTSI